MRIHTNNEGDGDAPEQVFLITKDIFEIVPADIVYRFSFSPVDMWWNTNMLRSYFGYCRPLQCSSDISCGDAISKAITLCSSKGGGIVRLAAGTVFGSMSSTVRIF